MRYRVADLKLYGNKLMTEGENANMELTPRGKEVFKYRGFESFEKQSQKEREDAVRAAKIREEKKDSGTDILRESIGLVIWL